MLSPKRTLLHSPRKHYFQLAFIGDGFIIFACIYINVLMLQYSSWAKIFSHAFFNLPWRNLFIQFIPVTGYHTVFCLQTKNTHAGRVQLKSQRLIRLCLRAFITDVVAGRCCCSSGMICSLFWWLFITSHKQFELTVVIIVDSQQNAKAVIAWIEWPTYVSVYYNIPSIFHSL